MIFTSNWQKTWEKYMEQERAKQQPDYIPTYELKKLAQERGLIPKLTIQHLATAALVGFASSFGSAVMIDSLAGEDPTALKAFFFAVAICSFAAGVFLAIGAIITWVDN